MDVGKQLIHITPATDYVHRGWDSEMSEEGRIAADSFHCDQVGILNHELQAIVPA